jgi:hypothetical protein
VGLFFLLGSHDNHAYSIISVQQSTGFLATEIGKVNEIKTPVERHMLMSDLHVICFLF